jgi:biotin transport system substrate-specific component
MQTLPAAPASLSASSRGTLANDIPRRLVRVLAATLVVAIAAHIAFPLPFTPVPFTLQPLAVLAIGLFLGPLDGALAMLAYLAEGASGLPVFSPTGLGGVAQLLGPTGGYLFAYPLVALICGACVRFGARLSTFLAAFCGCVLATVVLFAFGAAWLGHTAHLSSHAIWTAAVLPFLPGEAVKAVVAAGLFRSLHTQQRAR